MRLPRPRFTVRRLMLVVAVAGVLSAALAIPYRRARFESLRDFHGHRLASRAIHTDRGLTFYNDLGDVLYRYNTDGPSPLQQQIQEEKQRYHARMIAVYDHAARYPWLPVVLDPPKPE